MPLSYDENMVSTVTVSPKFQVVIPKVEREWLRLKPGERMTILRMGRVLMFIPVVPIKQLRGAFPGLTTEGLRDHSERFP